ncbi:MAG: aldehyde dehydrogenase family protein [Myxococcales bacterium]|nr:aldehyde dehydrogenase family protein [Myxococcales bacterium]
MAIATSPNAPATFASKPAKSLSDQEIADTVQKLRATFESGVTRSAEWRMNQLRQLYRMIEDEEPKFLAALTSDLGKCAAEGWLGETGFVLNELKLQLANLKSWMKPRTVKSPMTVKPATAKLYPEPLGVALVIAPWNYPFQLAISPLSGAISAGNCVVVKPSEVAPATSAVMTEMLHKYLDRSAIAVIEGGVPETTALLAQRFDHIFYTGNGAVGRIVMAAAAKNLTPVVLELGGKSPCIIDRDVNLEVAARRIAWGKFFNAGQTCVAPDYVLVHESVEKPFLEKLAATIREFYGDDPQKSPDYARIVNARHHKRVSALIDSGKVFTGGKTDAEDRYIAPTVLTDVSPDSPVMQEEIFGPVLPVLKISSLDEAVRFVNDRDKPLALYVFSNDADRAQTVIDGTSSGGACVNDTVVHLAPHELPFGGVGPSGMGAYHGKASFDCFTHTKSVLHKPFYLDAPLRYPPYTDEKMKWVKRLS